MTISFRKWLETAADFEQYDLQKRYDHFNALLFDNTLPKIPISYANIRAGGVVEFTAVRKGEAPDPRMIRMGIVDKYHNAEIKEGSLKMKISKLFKRSEQGLDAIMIHEMIHVFFAVNNAMGEQHGAKFTKMAKTLSEKVGFEIPLTDNIERYGLSDDSAKSVGVQIVYHKDGSARFAMMTDKNIVSSLPDLIARWQDMIRPEMNGSYGVKTDFYTVSTPKWTELSMSYPAQRRKPRDIAYYPLKDPEALEDLKANGKLLHTIAMH